jgi:hypothetical protein
MTFNLQEFKEKSKQDHIRKEKAKALSDQKFNIIKKYGKDTIIFNKNRVSIPVGKDLGVIILDRAVEDVLWYSEHPVEPNGDFAKTYYTSCFAPDPGIGQNCPLCKSHARGMNGVDYARFICGLTVLLVDRVEGEFVPVPNYITKEKQPVYGKQLWSVYNKVTQHALIELLEDAQEEHGTIRGLYIPLTRAEKKHAKHGNLSTLKGKGGIAKTYHFLGANTEAVIQKIAKKIQPTPALDKDNKPLTSELVAVHDYKWVMEPLNCYKAMADRLSFEDAVKAFDPNYVEKIEENSKVEADDFFSDDDEEVSLDLDVAEEEVVAEAPKAATTRTAGGRGRKLNLTKPLVVEKEEDDFGDLEEDAEEEIEEEELQAPVTKKKKVVIEDDGFDEFDLE